MLTPLGNWSNWLAAGYDGGSRVANPRFAAAADDNFCFAKASSASDGNGDDGAAAVARPTARELIGFADLPDEICNC